MKQRTSASLSTAIFLGIRTLNSCLGSVLASWLPSLTYVTTYLPADYPPSSRPWSSRTSDTDWQCTATVLAKIWLPSKIFSTLRLASFLGNANSTTFLACGKTWAGWIPRTCSTTIRWHCYTRSVSLGSLSLWLSSSAQIASDPTMCAVPAETTYWVSQTYVARLLGSGSSYIALRIIITRCHLSLLTCPSHRLNEHWKVYLQAVKLTFAADVMGRCEPWCVF